MQLNQVVPGFAYGFTAGSRLSLKSPNFLSKTARKITAETKGLTAKYLTSPITQQLPQAHAKVTITDADIEIIDTENVYTATQTDEAVEAEVISVSYQLAS